MMSTSRTTTARQEMPASMYMSAEGEEKKRVESRIVTISTC